jgi:hypothetical protein
VSAAIWLDRIRAAGVQLAVRDGKLAYKDPAGVMTAERRAWIKQHEAELVELLTASEPLPQPKPPSVGGFMSATSRGPCVHCDEPVTWHDGLRNWFGELTHHRCAGLWRAA